MAGSAELIIHVDGACRGNPGPASVGVEIRDASGKILKTISETIGNATNNVAEYFALIYALEEAVALRAAKVDVYTDSQLMARQFSGEYKVKEPTIRLLHLIVCRFRVRFSRCLVHHIPREENAVADKLANAALDNNALF